MDIVLRHTVVGGCIRLISPSLLSFADERDPKLTNKQLTLQDAASSDDIDENSPLLRNNIGDGSRAVYVDWYGPDDPENPVNWPLSTKVVVIAALCLVTVVMYTGSTFWAVCIDDFKIIFGVSDVVAQLGTSLFVLGFGLGPMVFSPLSEMPSIGRLKVYFWSIVAFILCQVPIPLCNNIWIMLFLRFMTGVLCSPVLAVGGGTVADMFGPSTRGYPMAFWELATWASSAMGPVYAGFTFERFGYQGPMWELVFLALLGLITVIFLLPETLPAAILHQRAKRMKRSNDYSTFVTYTDLADSKTSFSSVVTGLFVKSITLNFQEPIVFILNLYVALTFAIFFGMLESFPFVFKQEPHNFTTGQVGLTFLGIVCGGTVSMLFYLLFLRFYQDKRFDEDGNICPEERLLPSIPGAVFVPLGLFWYGWTTKMHWIMPVLGAFWYGIGMYTLFMAMLSYLPDAYPSVAATVIAGNCLMRSVLGFAFPLFTNQFYEALGPGIATSILGAFGVLFLPWPWILYFRGRQIRFRSTHARKDI